ncbi:MAG: circularly permuted type 2 ATP-grasp protein [Burkholderiales bacterium]|nr:circularly permuted type 2 ATP-grasp protein [Burkholderiales bacterium]MDP2398932.1 circularly permuted type 2 ATP-grasp protein [Burkholderiales bacterium]
MSSKRPFDEMRAPDGEIRPHYREYCEWLDGKPTDFLPQKQREADALYTRLGITFAVYGDESGTERSIPFDIIPRIIRPNAWKIISDGACQRVRALNAFLKDIYHGQEILKAGIIPAAQVTGNPAFRPEMQGIQVPGDVYIHIAGVDIVKTDAGEFHVLEDNLRTPSGVSYMLENRKMMMRLFPQLFGRMPVAPIDHYTDVLLDNLRAVAPEHVSQPTVVVMTPGAYNSAYFEHAFLAQQMGIELVEGQDLFVSNNYVYMRTTAGPQRVDVIYRRIDDDFLDPLAFRPDSELGVPGIFQAYRVGNVTLANAIGTGVADDKSTYLYVPQMIEFYLGEKPIISNVPTYRLSQAEDLAYTLAHLPELVVKEVQGSGGYGMLVGPTSTKEQIAEFRKRIEANPANYIAQPTLALSTCPTFRDSDIVPRHVDLRPYVLSGRGVTLVPGALTRVALREGSLVVNSSQGGGTKDTWVLEDLQC